MMSLRLTKLFVNSLERLVDVRNYSLLPKIATSLAIGSPKNADRSVKSGDDFDDEKCSDPSLRGLVLGVYSNEDDKLDSGVLTPIAYKYNKVKTNGRLLELLRSAGPMPKRGECRIFYNLEPNYSAVCVCGLGSECLGYNKYELVDEHKEAIRRAVATGCRALQAIHTEKIVVESFGHAESAAEGAALSVWAYQEHKKKSDQIVVPQIDLHLEKGGECDWEGWRIGLQKAAAQNLARQLQETPSNLLGPTYFAQSVVDVLCKSGVNVEVKVKGWAESQQMHSFLAISKASCEPPIFLELSYFGTSKDERPVVLVGQGITYDAGGICLKDKYELTDMRADMTGAACVVAVCRAIASLQLPINIRGLIPLCENVVGCNSFKPGDVTKTMSGKHIQVQSTQHEDALAVIDALLYAQNFWPKFILNIGTTTKETSNTFCEGATSVFTNSEELWQQLKGAAAHTGDRVWRMPLWNYFNNLISDTKDADLQTIGEESGGCPCKAAAFLRQFVPCGQWIHLDVRNVMKSNGHDYEYIRKGMAGRPTRTLVEFLAQLVCFDSEPSAQQEKAATSFVTK